MKQIRTLLLTDVVDSTKLSEKLGDVAMAALWAAHDRVARDLLVPHDGLEIDKTDGFLLLFDNAPQAVAYAVAYHRALASLDPPIRARAGLHVGEVILTKNAPDVVARGAKPIEVDGLAKPTAARVMGLASGGQTLLTSSAVAALGDTPHRVQSHGHWRMKGVSEPVQLFEVGDESAPFTPPPDGAKVYRVVKQPLADRGRALWLPIKEVKHSLPSERDAFVGRKSDLLALARRLDGDARLVSVLGIGGTGKTRLVTRYGWTWLGDYPGGVWFCDLSEARSVDGIVGAVARALDVPLGADDPVAQVGHAIAGRGRCLVLLDNFEQVARHASDTVGRWLDRASEAQFVVTSREVLGLPGEEALALAPLPPSDGSALFVARARSAKRGFEPNDVASIDALTTLLDGLPLAIELAAARVRVMPPAKLLHRMSQRFKLLASSGGRRDRQATLRATLDWSWDLLNADEQAALAQVSVFEGGFTLDAAEAVLALDEAWPMDAVQALVDKSLVRQVADERFDLLVSVQEYAAEKLEELGAREVAEARHGAWFDRFGTDDALESLHAHGGSARLRALMPELDNLVAACRRSVVRGDHESSVALLQAVSALIRRTGPASQAIELAERVAASGRLPPQAAAAVDYLWANALDVAGQTDEARSHLDHALAVHQEAGDRRWEARVLDSLALLDMNQGRMDSALARFHVALATARESGDRRSELSVQGHLGNFHSNQGQMDEAQAHHDAALAGAREVGDRHAEASALQNLGIMFRRLGRMDEAQEHYDEALGIAREAGYRQQESIVLTNLAVLAKELGRPSEALAHYEAALEIAREVGYRRQQSSILMNMGATSLDQGRFPEARSQQSAALAIALETGDRRRAGAALCGLGALCWLQGENEEALVHQREALVVIREVGDRALEGSVLTNLAAMFAKEGRPEDARTNYEAALVLFREVGDPSLQGHVLGNLGVLHLEQGRLAQSRACLREGERLVREVGSPYRLVGVLCSRVKLDVAEGQLDAARAGLTEATQLADRIAAGPESELALTLGETRAVLEGA